MIQNLPEPDQLNFKESKINFFKTRGSRIQLWYTLQVADIHGNVIICNIVIGTYLLLHLIPGISFNTGFLENKGLRVFTKLGTYRTF